MNLMEKKAEVSKRIGEMLLMGYKMLALSCHRCNNVLMQDRVGNKICAFCEMDQDAGEVQTQETKSNTNDKIHNNQDKNFKGDLSVGGEGLVPVPMSQVESVLFDEIELSAGHLRSISTRSGGGGGEVGDELSLKRDHVQYIRDCAQTIEAIRNLKKFN